MTKISIREYKKILRAYNVSVPKRRSDIVQAGESVMKANLCRRMGSVGVPETHTASRSRKRLGGLRRTRKRSVAR